MADADSDWAVIYREYSTPELESEVTWLKTQLRNPFNAQTEGSRSYSRSMSELRQRLRQAYEVLNERANRNQRFHGTVDFSGVGQP